MAIAKGVAKKVAYKKESTWGVLAGAASAKYLRRVTSNFNLTKETYESNEIRTDYQLADFRHGVRSADGSLSGELSPGSYADFMAAVVAKDFVAGASIALGAATLSVASSGNFFTLTRSAGDWIVDGIKEGDIIRMTGGSLNVANVSNNCLVLSLTATVLTVLVMSTTPLFVQAAIATVTVAVVGKKTFAPLSGHTDDSFTVEEFYSDITQSEVYTGNKVTSMAVKMASTGLVTTDFKFMGKNLEQSGATQYFTSPTAAGTSGIFASVQGALVVNGVPVALITSMDFTVERGAEAATVVGSNFAANIFTGRIKVAGNMSVYFQDAVTRGYFDAETPISLVVAFSTDGGKTADCVSFAFPKVKIGSAGKNDGEMGIVQDHSFTALLNSDGTTGKQTSTIQIQDTSI